MDDMGHINYMPVCYDAGRIYKGEEWIVKTNYDLVLMRRCLVGMVIRKALCCCMLMLVRLVYILRCTYSKPPNSS